MTREAVPNIDARIAQLVQTLRDAEHELQALTGGELDAVVGGEGGPYLLQEAQERLRGAEEAHHRLSDTQRSILDALPAHIALIDSEGKILAVNESWRRYGADNQMPSSDWAVGQNYLAVCDGASGELADEASEASAGLRRILQGQVSQFSLEYPCHSPSEQRWFRLSAAPLRQGDTPGAVVMHVDITATKVAEVAAARLAAIVESSDDAIVGMDLDGNIASWNRGAERVYGYTADEMVGGPIRRLIPAGQVDEEELAFERIIRGERVDHLEVRRLTRDQRLIDVSITVSPINNAAGTVIGVAKVARDITESKRAEAALIASERRFRRLVESNAQGVFFWTAAGQITGANDALLELLGLTRGDLDAGAVSWVGLTPPEYADLDARAVAEVAANGVCAPYEKEFLARDGSRVPVLIAGARVDDALDQGVAFVTDLTERKKLEKQFLRAQRMESIGTLAGGIAHDLNNVLAPILMSLELLRAGNPEPENQAILDTLQHSAVRGSNLVRQVLSFARGMSGDRIEVTLTHLLRDLVTVMSDTFPKSIEVRLDSVPELWRVTGDPTQLHQVFLNLGVNARDAMPQGGRLHISMANVVLDETYTALNPDARHGAYVMVKVADTGTGIPADVRDKVFEPFFTTKEIGKGTGLGLSTTLAIVKSHGGFINLYSEVGRGTTFKIYLPAETAAATAESAVIAQSGLPRGQGELVLVVDDEDAVREIAQRTLERYGYRVLLAGNGAEAVAVYAQRRAEIAVVLTDMAMPIMDGPALIIALNAMNSDVRIIGSSGLASNGGVARAVGAGVTYFIPKPYTARVLLTTLRAAITGEDQE